ncbi:MAG: membrane protein insertion efficiency factor YidD [Arcobacter sp.]|nr:MAG: membrane protein insertion efficiency factor YidD [Arcobacter sp.]
MSLIFSILVRWYQRYISRYTPASCRYYPTCSEYALIQLENNTFFKAIYFTIARILKCNQLFAGGIDYPIVKLIKHNNISFKKITIKYWFVPMKNNRFYVIKNREWKK